MGGADAGPGARSAGAAPGLAYRAEIDGLRALAVLPVVFFHAGIPGFDGGYLGVDVFFVISGYLITSLLLGEIEGRRGLLGFYERRVRRILPALCVVLACCLPAAWLLLTPEALESFGKSLIATTLFGSNVFFWSESSYFDVESELKPLLHTWSLAIEEQFYLFFPALLWLVYRRARRYTGAVLVGAALLSLFLAEMLSDQPRASFYLPHTRAWELLLGCTLAYRERTAPFRRRERAAPYLTTVGILLVFGSMAAFDRDTRHPGLLTLVPTLGTALVVVYGGVPGRARALLTRRELVAVGLVSYSFYLWHQPLFAFARAWSLGAISTPGYLALSALSLLLAVLSWRFVERPFRDRRRVSARTVWKLSAATSAAFVVAGAVAAGTHGLPGRFTAEELSVLIPKWRSAVRAMQREAVPCNNRDPERACVLGASDREPSWALVGDSHAASFAVAFHEELEAHGASGVQVTRTGCLYLPGLERSRVFARIRSRDCGGWSARTREFLLGSPPIRDVVLAGRYVLGAEQTPFDNGEGGVELHPPVEYRASRGGWDAGDPRRAVLDAALASIRELLAAGKNVHLVYPVPEVGWNVPDQLFKLRALRGRDEEVTTSAGRYRERSRAVIEAFDSLGDPPGLFRVRPDLLLCDRYAAGRCITELDGVVLYVDDDHLSADGSRLALSGLFPAVGEPIDPRTKLRSRLDELHSLTGGGGEAPRP